MNYFCLFSVLAGLCTAVLYVIPSEEDHEIFFIVSWFEDNVLEWADILSLCLRLSFLFVSYLMQAPCFQMCYLLRHIQYQMGILKFYMRNIHHGFENLDKLIFDDSFHKEIKRRLEFCIKRHVTIVLIGTTMVREGRIFILLFAISGAMISVSLMMFLFLVERSLPFTYLRLSALIFTATLTGIQYIAQGQSIQNTSEQWFRTLVRIKWYYWNRENQKSYFIILNAYKPFSIKFSQKLAVNYKLGITIAKAVYSIMSFMRYITDHVGN
nr:PREDICTED: uncharacterized protein LOC107398396 [Tribolium castaneum]|eukprot:XP_015837761.1 PREDICTED: uncharacterized protein LOC107398396 [Tribolium castaneum]